MKGQRQRQESVRTVKGLERRSKEKGKDKGNGKGGKKISTKDPLLLVPER